MPRVSLLSDLIDLHAALRADHATDPNRKKQRDRRIGTLLARDRGRPAKQLRGWLSRLELPGWRHEGRAGAQLFHVTGLILVVFGLIAGWGLARAVLHYTGDAPINIVNALVVLILPQLVLLLFWCLAALPVRLPLIAGLQSALRFLNPGRLARALAQRFAGGGRSLEVVWDPENAITLAPAARWLFSFWSQLFSVAFNVGALVAVFYLIVFSDLAFGWSTTLVLDSAAFHTLVGALAWPWHGFIPAAVPGVDLVEASRFYRLETGGFGNGSPQAAMLGGWWPFLVAALVCYGLLPRLFTLTISWLRLRHHLRRAMVRLPGAPELLARMNSPLISTASPHPEPMHACDEAPAPPPPREYAVGAMTRVTLVAWSGSVADADEAGRRVAGMGIEGRDLLHAGGARTTEQDRATIAGLCRERDGGVAIIVKAWEPPLLEFVDFVQQVRGRCGRAQPIMVLLWGDGAPVSDSDAEVWRLTLRQLKDPDLHIEAMP